MTLVSILVPCLNERDFIGPCLTSIRNFQRPDGVEFEVLVLDGLSTDGTREIVAAICDTDTNVGLIDNPGRIQSTALNLGVERASGEFIVRLDAHSVYPPDYVLRCFQAAIRTGADNVGGLVSTLARGTGYQASLVQALTTHPFGVGDSGFRTGAAEGPADTVPYGCFRRDIFARTGLFDVRLLRAQDYEFNRRIIAAGGTIWLDPLIRVMYYQQPDLTSFFRKQIEREAPYNAYMWYLAPYSFRIRHAVTAVFAAGVIFGGLFSPFSAWIRYPFLAVLGIYAILAVGASISQAVRYRTFRHALALPVCFFAYHFLHGIGVLVGLGKLALGRAPVQRLDEPWPGAGRFRAWPAG